MPPRGDGSGYPEMRMVDCWSRSLHGYSLYNRIKKPYVVCNDYDFRSRSRTKSQLELGEFPPNNFLLVLHRSHSLAPVIQVSLRSYRTERILPFFSELCPNPRSTEIGPCLRHSESLVKNYWAQDRVLDNFELIVEIYA
jgi:hypothetical protein